MCKLYHNLGCTTPGNLIRPLMRLNQVREPKPWYNLHHTTKRLNCMDYLLPNLIFAEWLFKQKPIIKFVITDWFYFTLFCTNNTIDDLVAG